LAGLQQLLQRFAEPDGRHRRRQLGQCHLCVIQIIFDHVKLILIKYKYDHRNTIETTDDGQ
jgi:hypothetical protein